MALDLNCRECQAGLAQVGQMAIGFNCMDHGRIGLEITMLMEIARVGEREKCCRDVCKYCQDNVQLITMIHEKGFSCWHIMEPSPTNGGYICDAYNIRQRAAKEGQGE